MTIHTDRQHLVIERAAQVLGTTEHVQAAWLEGSFASGWADPASDVDLHIAVADDVFDAVADQALDILGRIAPVLGSGSARLGPTFLIFAAVSGPVRVDLYVEPLSAVPLIPRPVQPKLLFDNAGIGSSFLLGSGDVPTEVVNEYLRQLMQGYFAGFMWPVRLAGRMEWSLVLFNAMEVVYRVLMPAMLLRSAPERTQHQPLHAERYLTIEQRQQVDQIVAGLASAYQSAEGSVTINEGQLAIAHAALVNAVLTELHASADALGAEWPVEVEAQVRSYFRDEIGLEV